MGKFLPSGRRRYAVAFVVVGASLGIMGAQCQPSKPPPPPSPTLSVAPADKDFGNDTADGASGNFQIFTVTNNGQETTTLGRTLQGGDPSQFELVIASSNSPTLCQNNATLAPGASCTQQVFFSPTKVGPASTTLVISGDPGGTVEVPLTGTGVP